MRTVIITIGAIIVVCVAYVLTHLALIEVGQEVVVLHKRSSDGSMKRARLWIVDEGPYSWLHHGYPDDDWIRHLEVEPIIEVERGGQVVRYRAEPDPDADARVHRLLREKYGVADRLVRFWAGTDTDVGFATRTTCTAVPVRLEKIETDDTDS